MRIAVLPLLLLVAAVAAAREPVPPVNARDGLALQGYDPVAYFAAGEPTPGRADLVATHEGVHYRFASEENRARFVADPARYVPQYGGYCAYAMSVDRIADIDPRRFDVRDGKLYLNNGYLAEALWSVGTGSHVKSADENWRVFPRASGRPAAGPEP